jgi:iron uptake system component EfeO
MVGTGNRTNLKVTGAAGSVPALDQDLQAAAASYRRYVESEAQALVDTTATFTAAITAGNLAKAGQAYPTARLHYERIEPIAECFGDLDPLIDMRADDATGVPFVGLHALEQPLFRRNTHAGANSLPAVLTTNVAKL